MPARQLAVTLALLAACGDDGVHHLPDAPSAPGVTLTVNPATVVLSAGGTAMVTATIERTDYDGDVVVSATSPATSLTIIGGTIAAGTSSIPLMVSASGAAVSAMHEVSVDAAAGELVVSPAMLGVTVAGLAGPPIPGAAAGEQAGSTVALSADGKRVIIGAPLNDATATNAGKARVYQRTGNTWTQVGADLDGEAAEDRYGGDVAISNDGSRIAIGSYLNDGGGTSSGTARVFELVGGTWTQLGADLDGVSAGDGHGWRIGLSASGMRIVVGAPAQNSVNGTAHVYDYVGTAWVAVGAPITGDHETGHDVTISGDGMRIAVSSPSPQSSDMYPGRVTVYEWSGTAWNPLGAAILGVQPNATAGDSIALSADGSLLAIGASSVDLGGANAGEVRVFRWDMATTSWLQVGDPLAGPAGSALGTSVSISSDGTKVLAGGPTASGNVRLFTRTGDTWSAPVVVDGGSNDRIGAAVALSADGKTAAAGAPYADAPGNLSGRVVIHDLP